MFYQDYQKQLNEESINPPIRGSIETEKKTCQNSGYQSPYKGFNRIKLSSTTRFTLRNSINPPIRGSIGEVRRGIYLVRALYQSPYKGFNSRRHYWNSIYYICINPPIRGSIVNAYATLVEKSNCINPPIRGSIEETQKSQEACTKDSKYQSPYKGFNRSMRKNSSARILGINPPIRGSIGVGIRPEISTTTNRVSIPL